MNQLHREMVPWNVQDLVYAERAAFLIMLSLTVAPRCSYIAKMADGKCKILNGRACRIANVCLFYLYLPLTLMILSKYIAVCLPRCENDGICYAPNQCFCSEKFAGPQCQYERKGCMNPPSPINAQIKCSDK